jgi:hypothetical protein
MPRIHPALAGCAIGLALAASPASASTSLEFGMMDLGWDTESVFQAGIRFGPGQPGAVGGDVAFAFLPQFASAGGFLGMLDLDLAYAVPLGGGAALVPRAGISGIGAVSAWGGGGNLGINAGGGLVVGLSEASGVRADVTYRSFSLGESGSGVVSYTLGVVWLGRSSSAGGNH